MNLPYSFTPLFSFLDSLDLTIDDLVKRGIISRGTAEKIMNGEQVMLATAAKICISIGCDLTDIVALNYSYDFSEAVDDGTQNYKLWTTDEEEQLIEEYEQGFPLSEIAKNLKRSPGAVSSRIKRMIDSKRLSRRVLMK